MNERDKEFLNEINDEVGALTGRKTSAPDQTVSNRRGTREAMRNPRRLSKMAITWIVVLSILVLLVGGGAAGYYIMLRVGRNSLAEHIDADVAATAPEDAVVADGGELITWNGKNYQKRDDIINILCMGVDRNAPLPTDGDEDGGLAGQADTLFLAVLNKETGALRLLNISRDSMIDVDAFNEKGEFVETREMQICLAYAYGSSVEASALNEVKSVSRLMYGVPIDAYAVMDLPGIRILNDAIGGVEVTVLEDLTSRDPALKEGESVLLSGQQAEIYVRSRDHAELDSNNQRMARQRQYASAFLRKAYSRIREDLNVALTLYQTVEAYSNTSFRLSQVVYLASLASKVDFSEQDIVTIPGEVTMGQEFAEYHVDDEALFEIILDTYYQEVS